MNSPRLVKLKKERPELFENEDLTALRFGSAVDCLLTSPERWEEDFKVVPVNKPTGLLGKFVLHLPPNLDPASPLEKYENAYRKSGYRKSIDWVVSNFWSQEDVVTYYMWLKHPIDKKILLSTDEYENAIRAKDSILSNEFTYKYFFPQYEHMELIHQVPIYFEYAGLECKALLDGILIDHEKQVIHPFDLKTTGKSVYEFPDSYIHFGYYRQCAFYEYAIQTEDSPVKKYIDDGYAIDDFVFIVVESKSYFANPAVIYRTNKHDRACGLHGGKINNKFYKGIDQLIEQYLWHIATDYWDMPLDLVKSNGEVPLNVFKDDIN